MKVVVIGCTHAGTAAIVNTAKLYKDAEITDCFIVPPKL